MPTEELKLYSPTLYVGLGGAGSDVVNRIAGKLKSRDDWKDIGDIFQFFAIDTDRKDMEKNTNIPQAHRFIISGFDKGRYVEEKLGRAGLSLSTPDPKVAQWVHDWYNFRSSQGAGAGQIRIESRLSLYNSFESTDLIKRLEGAIAKTIHMKNSFVDTSIKKMNVMLYFSVAGGTGSGSHLMMAAMLRHLVGNMGWSAHIIGINMLPTLFLQYIRNPRQREDILTNGYSALKEIEHLMNLKVIADDRSTHREIPFVFHPFIAADTVSDSPFDFMYIIDTTTEINVGDSYKQAVADGVYLQLMSPLFARKDSDYDNYEKNQKRLARELFTVHYGSFGCSVLLVPDKDILKYCALRLALDQMLEYVGGSFNIKLDKKEAEELTEEERRIQQDALFVEEMKLRLDDEESSSIKRYKVLGINPKYDYKQALRNVEEIEEESKKNAPEMKKFLKEIFIENHEVKIYEKYLKDIYQVVTRSKSPGGREKITGFEYTGVRQHFQQWLESKFLEEVAVVLRAHQYGAELTDPPSRDADDNAARVQMVSEELQRRLEKITDSIDQFRRELRKTSYDAGKYFQNIKNLSRFFSQENLDLVSQQFFSIVLTSELKIKLKVLEHRLARLGNFDELRNGLIALNSMDNAKYKELLESAKKEWKELNRKQEEEQYQQDYQSKWKTPVEQKIKTIRMLLYFQAIYRAYSDLLKGIKNYLTSLRSFSNSSQTIIENFKNDARHFLASAGEQANEFELDVEVLQDLNGKRMWDDYYETKIKGLYHLNEGKVVDIVNTAFANENLQSPRDKADYIKERLSLMAKELLKDTIVGKYAAGHERDKRGLLIDDGLKLEAELKFIEYLKMVNRWDSEKDNYEMYVNPPEIKSETLKKFEKEIAHFTKNYLEHKLLKCLRRSGILANINVEDHDVTEFGCKQQMIAYDTKLYQQPEQNGESHFVTILKKIAPEAGERHIHWEEDSKKVIFYQAILGIPLFTFRNVVGLMKEAYNKRVMERDWQNPRRGRQYPLHIDKNWESDDPFVDPTNLPINLDPDDAKMLDTKVKTLFNQFFATFLKLTNNGIIVWEDDVGYVIPKGKLGNKKGKVILGTSTREAVVKILKNVRAHELINQITKDLPLTKEDVLRKRKEMEPYRDPDYWSPDKPDAEVEIIISMLDSLYQEMERQEKELERRNRRPNLTQSPRAKNGDNKGKNEPRKRK